VKTVQTIEANSAHVGADMQPWPVTFSLSKLVIASLGLTSLKLFASTNITRDTGIRLMQNREAYMRDMRNLFANVDREMLKTQSSEVMAAAFDVCRKHQARTPTAPCRWVLKPSHC
jgi:hypothetical protein